MARAVQVPFLTVEDDGDLIVSFGLGEKAQSSLILLRTPKFEFLLDEHERGVSVSADEDGSAGNELLVSVKWSGNLIEIESTIRRYFLDVSHVGAAEAKEAKVVLGKMNFDGCFKLESD